jgi:hypothetical protein
MVAVAPSRETDQEPARLNVPDEGSKITASVPLITSTRPFVSPTDDGLPTQLMGVPVVRNLPLAGL